MTHIFEDPEVQWADKFAEDAFRGEVRPGDGALLINHSRAVAQIAAVYRMGKIAVICGLLHDVVEDTPVTQIRSEFGEIVSEIVDGLTDPPEWKGLPFLERKRLQAKRVATKNARTRFVKLADQTANVEALTYESQCWPGERCLEYAKGALYVAGTCHNSHPALWVRFMQAYETNVRKYMVVTAQTL